MRGRRVQDRDRVRDPPRRDAADVRATLHGRGDGGTAVAGSCGTRATPPSIAQRLVVARLVLRGRPIGAGVAEVWVVVTCPARRAAASLRPDTAWMDFLSEGTVSGLVDVLVRLVETAGATIIFIGCAIAFVRFVVVGLRDRRVSSFVAVRLDLGRMLALGLEFQLASDVLRTAVAPTLREIAELAAIAAIRTALNYFLAREIKEERAELARVRGEDVPPRGDHHAA